MEEKKRIILPCIAVCEGDISPRVITCGDPARAEKIAKMLDDVKCLAKNREYHTYLGSWKGVPVTVSSHGVGEGGAVIGFESLCRAGAKVIIRVGTCGGMQKEVLEGTIVIARAACREDGVTEKMLPLSYPAAADADVLKALEESAEKLQIETRSGIILTQALFYPGLLESKILLYRKAGVLAMENEAAGLFVVASLHGIKAGAILAADAPAFELVGVERYQPDRSMVARAVEQEIEIALDAVIHVQIER
ncbi:MAG: nucleoside phosphorylase [Lachnospiraceae bacterium]|nr:nucleoside phosphorylase [Lachnospiraceae bacterium]